MGGSDKAPTSPAPSNPQQPPAPTPITATPAQVQAAVQQSSLPAPAPPRTTNAPTTTNVNRTISYVLNIGGISNSITAAPGQDVQQLADALIDPITDRLQRQFDHMGSDC